MNFRVIRDTEKYVLRDHFHNVSNVYCRLLMDKNMTKWKIDVEESCKWLIGMGFMNSSKTLVLQESRELREGCIPRASNIGGCLVRHHPPYLVLVWLYLHYPGAVEQKSETGKNSLQESGIGKELLAEWQDFMNRQVRPDTFQSHFIDK